MKSIEEYKKQIRVALRAAKKSNLKALEPQIAAAAAAWQSMDLATQDIERLDSSVIETPQGLKGHPAFRIRKEAEASLTLQLKALGLTWTDVVVETDDSPLMKVTKKVAAVKGSNREIQMPDAE